MDGFLHTAADLVIPVTELADGTLCTMDGHTRLYTAWRKGIRQAMVFRAAGRDMAAWIADFAAEAREFAAARRAEPSIYTVSAGLDRCVAYILTNCSFMESVWRHSSPLHAGELFHGACEAIGRETPVDLELDQVEVQS